MAINVPVGAEANSADELVGVDRAKNAAPHERGEFGILNLFSHAFLIIWSIMVVFPLLWMVVTSFKSSNEVLTSPWKLPSKLHFDNFSRAWNKANIGQYFVNTIIVVVGGVFLTLLLSSMAAYILARYVFPGARLIYYAFIAGLTFPVFLVIVPLVQIAKNFHLANSLYGLIVIYVAYSLPFSVFFLAAFFRTLPESLAEAAFIDGCGHWRTFFQVMLPLAKPGLISIGIFNVLGQWNQYLLPLVLQTDDNKFVLAQGIASISVNQQYASDWGGLFAGLTISMLPILIVYVVFQRQVQAGMTAGAVK